MIDKEQLSVTLVHKLKAIEFDQLIPLIITSIVKIDCRRKAFWIMLAVTTLIIALACLKCLTIIPAALLAAVAWTALCPLVSFGFFYHYCKRVERSLLKEHHESMRYVQTIEGKEGFLWKFEDFLKKNPSVLHTGVDKTVKAILAASKRGRVTDYAHYSDVISQLQDVFE